MPISAHCIVQGLTGADFNIVVRIHVSQPSRKSSNAVMCFQYWLCWGLSWLPRGAYLTVTEGDGTKKNCSHILTHNTCLFKHLLFFHLT